LTGRTDAGGRARAEFLLPGRARVFAQHAEHGRANRVVELPLPEADSPLVLVLRRTP
jgi:hypothetical protein